MKTGGKYGLNAIITSFYVKNIGPMNGVKIKKAARDIMVFLNAPKPVDARSNIAKKTAAVNAIHASLGLPLIPQPAKAAAKPSKSAPTTAIKAEFYASWEWTTLRMKALKANGGRCECCGATSKDIGLNGQRVRLHVDHIKPLSKHWGMRLDAENLQVLCGECNKGKGAWDETDWRKEAG